MRTPEEFQNHVSHLIRQKKRQRRQSLAGFAAVMVLAVVWGGFWLRYLPAAYQTDSGWVAGGAVALDPSPLEEALKNGQTQCELPKSVELTVNGQSQTITDKETLSALCSLVLQCRPDPDYSNFSGEGDLLFRYTGKKSLHLFFTGEGFFTADGVGYSPEDPETWYQQLRSLLF